MFRKNKIIGIPSLGTVLRFRNNFHVWVIVSPVPADGKLNSEVH